MSKLVKHYTACVPVEVFNFGALLRKHGSYYAYNLLGFHDTVAIKMCH